MTMLDIKDNTRTFHNSLREEVISHISRQELDRFFKIGGSRTNGHYLTQTAIKTTSYHTSQIIQICNNNNKNSNYGILKAVELISQRAKKIAQAMCIAKRFHLLGLGSLYPAFIVRWWWFWRSKTLQKRSENTTLELL